MSNKRKARVLVDRGDVGGGGKLSDKHTILCNFHDFADLPHHQGERKKSCVLKCHGFEWIIKLYHGGTQESDDECVHVSIYFELISKIKSDLRVKYCFRVGQEEGGGCSCTFRYKGHAWGVDDFATRADVLDQTKGYLDREGILAVEVDIQIFRKECPVWTPKKKLQIDMLGLLESSKNADVIFSVGNSKFPTHRNILDCRAPFLASMAEGANGGEVAVSNVEPDVFRHLLRYVYGEDLPTSSDMERKARSLLKASDQFWCSDMKLHVEAEVVRSFLSADNAADWILFADSHNCALLKEASISYLKSNSQAVMQSQGWAAVTESNDIMKELLQAFLSRDSGVEDESNLKTLSVSSLREKLEEKGLDVDGTREMLVERLDTAISKGQT